MKSRVHLFISGRVQGVFFRSTTSEKARDLGLTGWVRNLGDGRVEAVLEGDEEVVDRLIRWCRKGPAYAHVENVEVRPEPYTGEFSGFAIRY